MIIHHTYIASQPDTSTSHPPVTVPVFKLTDTDTDTPLASHGTGIASAPGRGGAVMSSKQIEGRHQGEGEVFAIYSGRHTRLGLLPARSLCELSAHATPHHTTIEWKTMEHYSHITRTHRLID